MLDKSEKLKGLQSFMAKDAKPQDRLMVFLQDLRDGTCDDRIRNEKLHVLDDITCGVVELFVRVQLLRSGLLDEFQKADSEVVDKAMEKTITTCQSHFFKENTLPLVCEIFVQQAQELRGR